MLSTMTKIIHFFSSAIIALSFLSCSTQINEKNLSVKDKVYIQSLGVLNKSEEIEMFESNGGFKGVKVSGNFITSSRIVNYWIEDQNKEITSAYFDSEIDSINLTDLISKPTYASYLTVFKTDGTIFKVYVDADSTRTYQFYNHALKNWKKYKVNN